MALHTVTQQERNYANYHALLEKDTDEFSKEQLSAHVEKLNELRSKISEENTRVLQSLNETATEQVVQLTQAADKITQVAANDETAFALVKMGSDIVQIATSTIPVTF